MSKKTYQITCSEKDNEVFEIDEEAIENNLGQLLLREFILVISICYFFRTLFSLLLLDFRSHVENFIDNFKKVISAPLLIISHDVFKNTIHLIDDVQLHHFLELDFSGLDDGTNNLNSKCVKFRIINFKVLK